VKFLKTNVKVRNLKSSGKTASLILNYYTLHNNFMHKTTLLSRDFLRALAEDRVL